MSPCSAWLVYISHILTLQSPSAHINREMGKVYKWFNLECLFMRLVQSYNVLPYPLFMKETTF